MFKTKLSILSDNLLKIILTLSIPIIINNLIQTMYGLTDTFWVSKIGTENLAAITFVSPFQSIIVSFGQGITLAGSILISHYIGANDIKNSKDMANQLFFISVVFSISCSIICFIISPLVVSLMGGTGNIYTLGTRYLRIVLLDMVFLFIINVYSAVHQAQGDTISPMLLNGLGVITNMIIDPLFIIVFKWGISGAALATLISKIPCAVIAIILLKNKNNRLYIDLKNFKFNVDKFKKIVSVGLPSAIGNSTTNLGFLLMSVNVSKYGAAAIAAYGIGNSVNGIIFTPAIAMGSALSTIVGQNLGAGQSERAKKSYIITVFMSVSFLLIGGIFIALVSENIAHIFSDDSEVIKLGTDFILALALGTWITGIYNSALGAFQGAGYTKITMIVDSARLWIFRFGSLFIMESFLNMGVKSIWYSVVVSNAISSIIMLLLSCFKDWTKSSL